MKKVEDDHSTEGEPEKEPADEQRRDFLKGAAAIAAGGATLAAGVKSAHAYKVLEEANRYVPPGQWLNHLNLEWYEFPSGDPEVIEVWGYTDKISYKPGETVSFHVTTGAPTFDIRIYRDGGTLDEVHVAEGVTGQRSETPTNAYEIGCGWPALHTWTLPEDLRSGFYVVVFQIQNGETTIEQEHGFCVNPLRPRAPIAYILATSTWVAYNDWAGGSYYSLPGQLGGGTEMPTGEIKPEDVPIAPRVHLHRPWARGFMRAPNGFVRFGPGSRPWPKGHQVRYPHGEYALANGYSKWASSAGWANFDRHFAVWAEKSGYELDYFTQQDLHANPNLLDGYKCAVLIGHDEYWSWDAREGLDNWIESGGHLARFAGNMLWNIRYEDDGLVQVCYKSYAPFADPYAKDPDRVRLTTNIFDDIRYSNWPLTQTFASSSVFGHLNGVGSASPRSPGFIVYRPQHWMLEDTDLYYGDAFGAEYTSWECDGVPYTIKNGYPYPTDEMGTPQNIEIAAMFPASNGEDTSPSAPYQIAANDGYRYEFVNTRYGVTIDEATEEQKESVYRGCGILAYMPKGQGEVATAAVTDWTYGLGKDPYVDQITHNVLKRFTA